MEEVALDSLSPGLEAESKKRPASSCSLMAPSTRRGTPVIHPPPPPFPPLELPTIYSSVLGEVRCPLLQCLPPEWPHAWCRAGKTDGFI